MNTEMDKSRQAVIELASDWFVRSRDHELTAAEKKDLTHWLKESPVHVEEYLAIASLWGGVSNVEGSDRMNIELPALAPGDDGNVVELLPRQTSTTNAAPGSIVDGTSDGNASSQHWYTRGCMIAIVASLILAIGLGATAWLYESPRFERHKTVLGEQRSLVLDDGSVLEMNTISEIELRYDESARYITLLAGEVFLDVRKDPNRPFVVRTGDTEIRVLGTKFNVYKQVEETAVTVLEGNVTVAAGIGTAKWPFSDEPDLVSISRGEQAIIDNDLREVRTVAVPDLDKYFAWTDRRLIFEDTRLDDILAEFSRYNNIRYKITDDQAAKLRLTAVFGSQDLESLVAYLVFLPSVSVLHQDGLLIVSPAPIPSGNL